MSRPLTSREFFADKAVVLRAMREPLDPLRWAIDLNCGHKIEVTQRSQPKLDKAMVCPVCRGRRR